MRKVTRYRLVFVVLAICLYTIGVKLTPAQFLPEHNWPVFAGLFALYFAVIPALHLLLVILATQQKWWKLLIPFSTSSLVCRYSMPTELAGYFEFISYLRYPLVAILLVIELAIVYHVVRMLWKCRTMQGDPRASAIRAMNNEDEKKRTTAILFAYEPATWYYLLPFLSRNHVPTLAHLRLSSSSLLMLFVLIVGLILMTSGLYYFLAMWSELVAIIVSSLVGYSLIYLIANYRISKHHSVYVLDDHLVINNNFLNLMVIPLKQISHVEVNTFEQPSSEALCLGKGTPNIKLILSSPSCYYGMMATLTDSVSEVYLSVDNPESISALNKNQIDHSV